MEIFIAILIIVFAIIIFFVYRMGVKTRENELFSLFRSHLCHADEVSKMNCIFCEEEKKEKILEESSGKTDKGWEKLRGSTLKEKKSKLSENQKKELKQLLGKIKSK